jgi:DNA-binding XRE family transcriptional regulator
MNELRVIRAKKRVSQFQLRLMAGINQSKLSHIENDLVHPSKEEKKKIAKALGVSIKDIWKEEHND